MSRETCSAFLVDVVVPVHGALSLAKRAIVSLLPAVTLPFKLWLVDDKPGDTEQAEFFGQLEAAPAPVLQTVRNEVNLGFGPSNNKAAALGSAPFILFLNSDTVATVGFLERMLLNMLDPEVGIVGAKLLFAEGSPHGQHGTVQHCGVFRTQEGEPFHAYVGATPYDKGVSRWRELNCVTGACLLIRRTLFEELGGFDPAFQVGAFEDVDLCWEARRAGWRVVYDPSAVVYHHYAGSGKEITHRCSEENKRILLERWGDFSGDAEQLGG